MIACGFVLFAVGAADLVRAFVAPARRWIGLLVGAVLLLVAGLLADAVLAALAAVALAAAWVWLSPVGAPARAGFWPVVVLGALATVLVIAVPARGSAGLLGGVSLTTPLGELTVDHVALVLGVVVFLMESANVVVRTALQQENVQIGRVAADDVTSPPAPTAEESDAAAPPSSESADENGVVEPALKGGRLIGPLERIMVLALTLAAMYPLLAAVLAAKGIVRFPEISRDSAAGNRAEYFLIGSLVSWVIALAAAFLLWWGFATP